MNTTISKIADTWQALHYSNMAEAITDILKIDYVSAYQIQKMYEIIEIVENDSDILEVGGEPLSNALATLKQ